MVDPVPLEPGSVYSDDALSVTLGIPRATLLRARRLGHLRHARTGQRILYLGQWVRDWLEREAGTVAREKREGAR